MAEQSKAGEHPKHENLKSWLAYLNTVIQGLANFVLAFPGLSCLLFGTWTHSYCCSSFKSRPRHQGVDFHPILSSLGIYLGEPHF